VCPRYVLLGQAHCALWLAHTINAFLSVAGGLLDPKYKAVPSCYCYGN
jgi:hypothetical protein